MRSLSMWRLTAILLLSIAVTSTPLWGDPAAGMTAIAQGASDRGNEGDDGNRGHGNDEDGHDEDNPGRGNDDGPPGNPKNGNDEPVVKTEAYTVAVDCEYVAGDDNTTCTFTGTAPEDAKDVSHIDLPQSAVCADVVDGDFEYVDPDPNTHVTGYKSRGSEGEFTLVLDGEVTTSGTTTYWFKTGDGVFPATGEGLACEDTISESDSATATETFDSQENRDTGTLVVETYTCTGVPADTSEYDWFGMCEPGSETLSFTLLPAGSEAGERRTAETDTSGEAEFASLTPGSHDLDLVDASWCHARSDNVTTEGDPVIEPGATTTAWIFMCEERTGV